MFIRSRENGNPPFFICKSRKKKISLNVFFNLKQHMSLKDSNEENFEDKEMQMDQEEEDIVLSDSSQHSNPKIITRLAEEIGRAHV